MRSLIVLITMIICGCSDDSQRVAMPGTGGNIITYDDSDAGVRCYMYFGTGVSCVKVR